jgi:hypothetical protein
MHDPVGIEHGNAAGPYEFVYPAETAVSTASEATCVSEVVPGLVEVEVAVPRLMPALR